MLKEFRDFIARGNVIDLAVGVIIGAAFTAIVKSLTENLINPLLGLFIGQIDFSAWVVTVGAAHFKIGLFVNDVISFLITAFIIFLIVKALNKMQQHFDVKKQAEVVAPTPEELYLKEIRDLLAAQNNATEPKQDLEATQPERK